MPASAKSNRTPPATSTSKSGKPKSGQTTAGKAMKGKSSGIRAGSRTGTKGAPAAAKSSQEVRNGTKPGSRQSTAKQVSRSTTVKSSTASKPKAVTNTGASLQATGTTQKVKTTPSRSSAKLIPASKSKRSPAAMSSEADSRESSKQVNSKRVAAASRRTANPASSKTAPSSASKSTTQNSTLAVGSSKSSLQSTATSSMAKNKPTPVVAREPKKLSGTTNSKLKSASPIHSEVGNGEHECLNSPHDMIEARPLNPQWLQIRWSLSKATLHRAMSAMAESWHTAKPTLRLLDVTDNDSVVCSNSIVRDIVVGSRDHLWFTHVDGPGRSYRIVIGFSSGAKFHPLAKSSTVHMDEAIAQHGKASESNGNSLLDWPVTTAEGRLNQNELTDSQLASLAAHHSRENSAGALLSSFQLNLESELIVHGTTHPLAILTLMGKPTPVSPEGRFQLRMKLLPGRQVIPAVAIDPNGGEERTVVLAIDISSRELEPRNYDDPNNAS
ncbi:hypothetical protein Plim_0167 [Planctopirus limnophila DSM 3776]|uniref:DUF4912 domain-containing protein n=2 Tax=Planctopirus limnophila TaxID=120 RepID=D5SN92_PLAL2|nr:hypothetical protein Plim_0167 [Planctopirus limnophila DSM 3776]